MKKKVDLSIVIVSYNTCDLLIDCIHSIKESVIDDFNIEIIIYDNGSEDQTADIIPKKFPELNFFRGKKNIGFSKANNYAIKQSSGRLILLLNSDTRVEPDVLAGMIRFFDQDKDIGAATCKLVLSNKEIDPACHRGFPTPWAAFSYFSKLEALFPKSRFFSEYHLGYKNINSIHEIDVPSGAFFMVRREIIETVGLLDEDYFMYAEDIDWAFRIKKSGFKVYYNPSYQCLHLKKQSGRNHTDNKRRLQTEIMFHENNRLFYRKHFKNIYPPAINFFIELVYYIRLKSLILFGL